MFRHICTNTISLVQLGIMLFSMLNNNVARHSVLFLCSILCDCLMPYGPVITQRQIELSLSYIKGDYSPSEHVILSEMAVL